MQVIKRLSQPVTSDTFDSLKSAAVAFFGDLGAWQYDEWEKLNALYFGGANVAGPLLWGLIPHGRFLGYYVPTQNMIVLHQSLVAPSTKTPWGISYLDKPYASDVLLHEMIHQRIRQDGWIEPDGHNHFLWVNEVNRIAPLLGFQVKAVICKQKRINGARKWVGGDGALTLGQLARFPHECRAAGYYDVSHTITSDSEI